MDFSLEEKNKRHADFWSREHEKNNYQKINKQFDDLWEQSDYEDYDTFMSNLDMVMVTAPQDSRVCGLKGYGTRLPYIDAGENRMCNIAIDPTSSTNPLPPNTVCKIKVNIISETGDEQISFAFGKLPDHIRAAFIVEVREGIRLRPEKG